ncbi:LysR family transcriptional regulator, partial [Escherichia coli]
SASLTDLEGQLGVQLFDRVGKRLVTNEHGRLLYPKALALLEQALEVEQLFKKEMGAVRLAASTTIGNYMLPPLLAEYRHDHPTIPLELNISNTEEVIKSVMEFRADVGLIEGVCHSPELITEPWLKDELVIFAAPNNALAGKPLTLKELRDAPWVLRERGSGTRDVLDQLLFAHLPGFHIFMELGNSEAIKHAVRFGMGISCLSRRVIDEQLANGSLVELQVADLQLQRTLYLIYHRQKHLSNAIKNLLAYCK